MHRVLSRDYRRETGECNDAIVISKREMSISSKQIRIMHDMIDYHTNKTDYADNECPR